MLVLITGGCGFVGATLVRKLNLLGGVSVQVLDNEVSGTRDALKGAAYDFILGDIRDRSVLDRAMSGVDVVVHLAADTGVLGSIADPVFNFDVNVQGGFNVLQSMRAAKVGRLVSASTGGAILGDARPPVHEDMTAQPMSPYGASKLMMEGYCSAFAASYDLATICLRFSNVYGPGSLHKGSVVATFCRDILAGKPLDIYGDGEQVRDFIYIDDLCCGIAAAVTGQARGVIQLGSGRPLSINALVSALQSVVAPARIEVNRHAARVGEVRSTWCDISRARQELDFNPSTPLEQGLAKTWDWFVEQYEGARRLSRPNQPAAKVA